MGDAEQGGGSAPSASVAAPSLGVEALPSVPDLAADLTLGAVDPGQANAVAAAPVAAVTRASSSDAERAGPEAQAGGAGGADGASSVELASGLELEELELIEDIDLIADLDDEEDEPAAAPAGAEGAWRTRPPPLPRGGVVYDSNLPILSVERDVPTQIIRADKILARAREVKRQEAEAVRTLLFTPDADSVARHVAVTHARRSQRLRQAGLAFVLLAIAITLGSLLALHRDRAGQWLASLSGDGFDEPIATEPAEVETQALPEEVVEAPPPKRAPDAPTEAAKPEPTEVAKPEPVQPAKPEPVQPAKPEPTEVAKREPVQPAKPEPVVAKAAPERAAKVERRAVNAGATMTMPKPGKVAPKNLAAEPGGRTTVRRRPALARAVPRRRRARRPPATRAGWRSTPSRG